MIGDQVLKRNRTNTLCFITRRNTH